MNLGFKYMDRTDMINSLDASIKTNSIKTTRKKNCLNYHKTLISFPNMKVVLRLIRQWRGFHSSQCLHSVDNKNSDPPTIRDDPNP